MYKNILVPVSFDADRNAQGAMAVAKALCSEGGKITCLHVLELLPNYAAEYLPESYREDARAKIMAGLKDLIDGMPNATSLVEDGYAARNILAHAENNDVDLIIVASHQPGMQDYLLGSTAGKVVRHAHCAVHVLR